MPDDRDLLAAFLAWLFFLVAPIVIALAVIVALLLL